MEQCFSDNLKDIMKSQRITQDRLAEVAGVTRQAVNQWINKETQPSLQSVLEIANFLNLSVEKLVYNNKSINSASAIPRRFFPICTGIKDGKLILEENWSESYMITNNIPVDADFCFIMYDNSMSDYRIHKGDIVVIKKTKQIKQDKIALCILNNMLVLRRYSTSQNGDIMLISGNKYQNYVVTSKDT